MALAGGIGGRVTSWDILRNEGIHSLPVDPVKIAQDNKVKLVTYSELAKQKNNLVKHYQERYSEAGFCYFIDNRFYIAYDDTLPEFVQRYTIMHELAHIFAGDIGPHCNILDKLSSHDYREKEAHRMTRRVLCPSIVLHMCDCGSSEEIAALCGVEQQVATFRYIHLQSRRKNNIFLKSSVEREVLLDFLDFITEYLSRKNCTDDNSRRLRHEGRPADY